MQIRSVAISVVATVALASAAVAQRSPARTDARGTIAADSTGRRHDRADWAKLTPEQRAQMKVKRDSVRQARLAAMTPEQRKAFEARAKEHQGRGQGESRGRRQGGPNDASLTPQQRAERKAQFDKRMQERLATMTPEQRARFEKARAERTRLEGEVKAGRLTQDQARAQFRAWRKANGK
jgi:hypothetical protein